MQQTKVDIFKLFKNYQTDLVRLCERQFLLADKCKARKNCKIAMYKNVIEICTFEAQFAMVILIVALILFLLVNLNNNWIASSFNNYF